MAVHKQINQTIKGKRATVGGVQTEYRCERDDSEPECVQVVGERATGVALAVHFHPGACECEQREHRHHNNSRVCVHYYFEEEVVADVHAVHWPEDMNDHRVVQRVVLKYRSKHEVQPNAHADCEKHVHVNGR